MLILNVEDVKYCHVIYPVAEDQKILPGVIYRDKLFAKAKVFEKTDLDNAIKYYRERYLDNEERRQIQSLILQEENEISLWRHDEKLKLARAKNAQENPADVQQKPNELQSFVAKMRAKGGLDIKARPYKLKLYHRCFVGSEAVSWMVENLKFSRQEAVAFGQKLIDKKILHHVCDEHQFKDEQIFYRFYEDEGKSIWTDKLV
jgi:Domain found in Dishevelled, Egl-10, and Pleckstrin (DEP)